MKPSLLTRLLTSFGGLSLTVGALLWPTVSQAQGFCYMVDADGQVTNLDDLCESGGAAQELPPQGEATSVDSPQPAAAPQGSSFTISVPTGTDPSEAPGATPSDSADAEFTGDEPMGEQPTGNESMGEETVGEEPAGRQERPGIPVEGITTPTIEVPQIQTPAAPGS